MKKSITCWLHGVCTLGFFMVLLFGYFMMSEKIKSEDGSLWCVIIGLTGYFVSLIIGGLLIFSNNKS